MKTNELQQALNGLWTVKDLARRSRRTPMTIHQWRKKRIDPLCAVIMRGNKRPAVRFVPADTRAWAKRNQITLA